MHLNIVFTIDRIYRPDYATDKDDQHDVDLEEIYRDERPDQYEQRKQPTGTQNGSAHANDDVADYRGYTGLHTFHDHVDDRVAPERRIEERNNRQDDERREDCPDYGNQGTKRSSDIVADQDGSVHRYGSRRGLGYSRQVQHLLFIDPSKLLYEFFPHERDNDESPAEREGAQLKRGQEKFEIFLCFLCQFLTSALL